MTENKRGETPYVAPHVAYLDEAGYIDDSGILDDYSDIDNDTDDVVIIVEENNSDRLYRSMNNWIKNNTPTEEDIEAYWDEVKDNVIDFLSERNLIANKKDIDIVDNTVYIKKIKIKKIVDTIKLNIPLER